MSSWQNGKVSSKVLSGPVRGIHYPRPKANTCERTASHRQTDRFRNSSDKLVRHREQNGDHIKSWGTILLESANTEYSTTNNPVDFDMAAYINARRIYRKR